MFPTRIRNRRSMRVLLCGLVWAALCTWLPSSAVADLAPAIQADLYLVQTEEYLKEKNYVGAREAMEKLIKLAEEHKLTVPDAFHFKHAQVLSLTEEYAEASAALHRYLEGAGQAGQHYREALMLLHEMTEATAAPQVGSTFRDCDDCPEMVIVPAGTYRMGSPASESGRGDDEGPVHEVTIGRPFAVGMYEVTRGEFAIFVNVTGHDSGTSCWLYDGGWEKIDGRDWRDPGYRQTSQDPVVCVNWHDAQAYVNWLSRHTGNEYRLLSESEWEYAARAGTITARYWGETEAGQCGNANGADRQSGFDWAVSCDDGYERTAPVGSFQANGYGLYDALGNVWEWTEDCWNESYSVAPSDGSTWDRGDCSRRVVRGGSWGNGPRYLRSASRGWYDPGDRNSDYGFRVARTLDS